MSIKFSDVLARIMNGLGFSAIFTFIALTALLAKDINPPVDEIWKNMLGSMLIGAYYGAASFLFQFVNWSPLKMVITHFSLSFLVFLPIALWTGWLSLEWKSLLIGFVIFIVVYGIFWCGYAYYYWRLTKEMNESIDRK
ncbi:DUF3021 domain-containing protein [Paenibacillus camelliae]|uniref:DUF3021 domain-containing protein n=1 Tax=Paenibacillus camelliae TaxID=512410 RepID=UPI00203F3A77|nr:DUF3021 domain-containing protein [Paenibacillus camelliae]MCM3634139.1 DUF3021 domain-containing protein [Paenibacillus camelliae]